MLKFDFFSLATPGQVRLMCNMNS